MPEKLVPSKDPIKAAVAKVTSDRIKRMSGLRVAKPFAYMRYPFVGFEGHDDDRDSTYYQLRIDYDPVKLGHVNVMIGNEKFAFLGEKRAQELKTKNEGDISEDHYEFTQQWVLDIINKMNGAYYCNGTKKGGASENDGREKDPECIEGMKKFMGEFC